MSNVIDISGRKAVQETVPEYATSFAYLLLDGVPLHVGIAYPVQNQASGDDGIMVQIHEESPPLEPGAELILLPKLHDDVWTVYPIDED